jgi:hypothetical protein
MHYQQGGEIVPNSCFGEKFHASRGSFSSGGEKWEKCIRQQRSVRSISLPLRPKRRNGLVLAPWSGAPNQSVVGGAPVAQCYKERVGATACSSRFTAPPHTPHPTNPNPTRGSTWAAGSSTTATAEDFLLHPTYMVPPPDARPHRPRHRRPRATTGSPVSSRGRPCDHDLQDGVRLRTSVQPWWSASLHSLLFF